MTALQRIIVITLVLLLASSCKEERRSTVASTPEIESRIESLLSQMTLDEKIGQMNQISVGEDISMYGPQILAGNIGSILNSVHPNRNNEYQRLAVKKSRLHIPLLIGRDVIHGFKTIFPIPIGMAATFDERLAEESARVAAREASAVGVRWTFSPMIDIGRDPRWGRVAEGFGEDTYLSSMMGAAFVKGYQDGNGEAGTTMAACAKHFVGYGAAEGGRDYNSTYIPERMLRNVYLPPFQKCVETGAMTVMTSLTDNDGIPSTGNTFIVQDVLKGEWGFDGFVVSDWSSGNEMISLGFAKDSKDVASISANAGVDMDMMSFAFIKNLKTLVREGTVKMETIDNAVRNILRVKFLLGLFDNPYVDTKNIQAVTYADSHLDLARIAAEKSAILLKNDNNTLPLDENRIKTILITGSMSDAPYDQLGTWAPDGDPSRTVTPLKAIMERYGDNIKILYKTDIPDAVSAARQADVILAFVGEEAMLSGEAHCLADINLQGSQSELLSALKKTGKPVIVTIMAGRPLTIGRDLDNCDALLYSFHPGTMGGVALANLIFGKAVPSGRVPMTFLSEVGQIPMYYNHNMTGHPFRRAEVMLGDISLGKTSFYLDADANPLFPFGFGLSYTTFEYSDVKIDKASYHVEDTVKLLFRLTNTGKYDAEEVCQLYVRDILGSVTRPVKELKGFERVHLKSGESRELAMALPVSELAFWDREMNYTVEEGEFQIWVSGDSVSGEKIPFEITCPVPK